MQAYVSSLRAAETRAFLVHAGRIAISAGTAAGAQALLWMIAARYSLYCTLLVQKYKY